MVSVTVSPMASTNLVVLRFGPTSVIIAQWDKFEPFYPWGTASIASHGGPQSMS